MVTNKRKKVVKYRGGSTHGGGARKKRRGAGSRGGRGFAGSGKRAGHMKMKHVKAGHIMGQHGFTSKSRTNGKAVNVHYFTSKRVQKLVAEGKALKEGAFYSIDLGALGYTKLLGTGNTSLKLKITVAKCSPRAVEKIKAAGGEVVASVVEDSSEETA
ncbi:MAG TPA: uL15m family ribosomal protein [Candidatus Nanoarchaeia archaeon]|nr:uL15m family ribosomal protein [Candidatus Nanoarchaeia archaeon]